MKPAWLNKKIDLKKCRDMDTLLSGLSLNTVCHSALCPNIGECFAKRHATFLILGSNCTRSCRFCGVSKKIPQPVDIHEPQRVAEAAFRLGLSHVVITSVTRDDLADGGAFLFAETVKEVRRKLPQSSIEVLIPDFNGDITAVETVARAKPDIIAHNVETVPSLYSSVRSQASYLRSISVLKAAKDLDKSIFTKSGIMLGMGETEEEVLNVFADLVKAGCDFLSIGQYLAPSKQHYPVKEYIPPEKFIYYKAKGMELGFSHIESGPYVRSSYSAGEYLCNV